MRKTMKKDEWGSQLIMRHSNHSSTIFYSLPDLFNGIAKIGISMPCLCTMYVTVFTSGSRTSETGGPIFAKICERPFLRSFPKNFCISPQEFHLSPKISDDLFLVIHLSRVLYMVFFHRGAKSAADIDTGAKILTFQQNHNTSIALSGQTPLPISMGG